MVALSTVWAIVTLIVIFTLITTLYRQASERGFDSLLSAHLFNLIGSVGVSESGALTGSPDLGDLRFSEPRSGWYWSVDPASDGVSGYLHSSSMTERIPSPGVAEVPFDSSFQRSYTTEGLDGEKLQVFESEFVLDAKNRAARFRVMGNESELEEEIARFQRRLLTYLSLFGAGMIAINAAAILLGLQPLRRVRNALAMVREGTAQRLDGRFPPEIEPLANETNALIENNRRIVERSRTQVGNLAHSLKTPLAVLLNEGRALGGEKGQLIAGQAASMQQQVEHYLQRARVAAQRDSVVYRTPVAPLTERMVRVVRNGDQITRRHNFGGNVAYFEGHAGPWKQPTSRITGPARDARDLDCNDLYVSGINQRWIRLEPDNTDNRANWIGGVAGNRPYGWANAPR